MTEAVADMRKKLVKHGNSRALVIDKALLEVLGIDEDDEVLISTDGRSLIVSPATQSAERQERIEEAMERVDARYADTLRRLAE